MISIDEFKAKLADGQQYYLMNEVLLADGAMHVTNENIEYISQKLSSKYQISNDNIDICITGSAKLGFSLVEKRKKDGTILPRYRLFSANSDIDVAIVSKALFERVWLDLSQHAHKVTRLPWDSKKLGDYMVCGWLRPDHFPKKVRIRSCDDWSDLFWRLSADPRFERHNVRGGLFYSREQLSMYLNRSLSDCAIAEELRK